MTVNAEREINELFRVWKNIGRILLLVVAIAAILVVIRGKDPHAQTTSQTMLFTWPGDDGDVGTCAGLDLRWRTTPISGTDTLSWWNAATRFNGGYPVAKVSGTRDSILVTGLPNSAQLYAIVRAFDEMPNLSGFSNVAAFVTQDFIPPGRITDLRVGISAPFSAFMADAIASDIRRPAGVRDLTPPGALRSPPRAPGTPPLDAGGRSVV